MLTYSAQGYILNLDDPHRAAEFNLNSFGTGHLQSNRFNNDPIPLLSPHMSWSCHNDIKGWVISNADDWVGNMGELEPGTIYSEIEAGCCVPNPKRLF